MCVGWPPLPLGRRLPGRVGATAGKRRRRRRSTRRMRKSSRRRRLGGGRRGRGGGGGDGRTENSSGVATLDQCAKYHLFMWRSFLLCNFTKFRSDIYQCPQCPPSHFDVFLFQNNRNNNIGGKEKKQKEKSACQNYLTHDGQSILDCGGPWKRRREGWRGET